ncbi:hypothetical protein BDQ12DRAFT_727627 [Crucibulum laeve]|uniref:Lysine-specific metallo-endopeptidase domain-containing protein n=1 Tax=Crucibulum laeve TaxID=68775 RepID=A0A5C3LLZ7_9AGAR|nr:hypothetical protein BDQ12DRAFT_727627 [Crucibulum laeve]
MFSNMLTSLLVLATVCGALASPTSAGNVYSKRHVLNCSNTVRGPIISQAYADAKVLATVASQYIATYGSSDSLYVDYFKTNDPAVVKGYFDAIANDATTQTLNCPVQSAEASCPGNNAFTRQPSGNIYFCDAFFNLADQSALCTASSLPATKSGTMVHELGHALNHRADIAGSCSASRALSVADALANTTSYSCFARQVYRNTQC